MALFASPEMQHASSVKTDNQLAITKKRLNSIKERITKTTKRGLVKTDKGTPGERNKSWDWTHSYSSWDDWEDLEELKQAQKMEEQRMENLLDKQDALGHYHDHTKERQFFELPEEEKFKQCEQNRVLGNYLYKEGVYSKAAEHYQIAIAYYEYCFPDDPHQQTILDNLRRACLCNVSLCYTTMGYLRKAIESAELVLRETNGTHAKALFRRAHAYRHLDDYDLAKKDLETAIGLAPGDPAIVAEMELVMHLKSQYRHNQQEFATMALTHEDTYSDSKDHVGIIKGFKANADKGKGYAAHSTLNISVPVEPNMSSEIQQLGQQLAGVRATI